MTDKVISMADFKATKEALEEGKDPDNLFQHINPMALAFCGHVLHETLQDESIDLLSLMLAFTAFADELEKLMPFAEEHLKSQMEPKDET